MKIIVSTYNIKYIKKFSINCNCFMHVSLYVFNYLISQAAKTFDTYHEVTS